MSVNACQLIPWNIHLIPRIIPARYNHTRTSSGQDKGMMIMQHNYPHYSLLSHDIRILHKHLSTWRWGRLKSELSADWVCDLKNTWRRTNWEFRRRPLWRSQTEEDILILVEWRQVRRSSHHPFLCVTNYTDTTPLWQCLIAGTKASQEEGA